MGFFDPIGDAFNKAKNKASNVIDTGRDKLKDATRLPSRVVHSAASTVYHELNDSKRLVSKAKKSVVKTAHREWNDSKRLVSKAKKSVVKTAHREWNDSKRLVSKAKNSVVKTAHREWNDSKRLVSKAKNNVVKTAHREWNDSKRLVSKAKNNVVKTAHREWNDTTKVLDKGGKAWDKAWDKAKSAGNFIKDHASDIGHGALDVAGFVPVVGDAADLVNAGWYLAEGDKVNAALSVASAIPIVGDAAKIGKYGAKVAKYTVKVEKAAPTIRTVANGASAAFDTASGARYAYEGDWTNAALSFASAGVGGVVTTKSLGGRRVPDNAKVGDATAAGRRPAIEAGPRRLAIEAGSSTTTPRVARRPGTVANVTGDAGDAVSSLGRGAKPVNPGAREVNRPLSASGTNGKSRGQSSPVVRRPKDERGDVWRSSYLQKGGAKTSDPASKKARGEFRDEMDEAIAERIAIHRQKTGTPHPQFEGGKVGNYDQATGKFTLRSDLEAGHTTTIHKDGREIFAIEARPFNRATSHREKTEVFSKRAMEIDGIPFQNQTVRELFPHLAKDAPSVPGFTTSVKINGRGVEVAANRLSDEQSLRLRQILKGQEKLKNNKQLEKGEEPLNRNVQEDRELYRAYRQALMDSRPSRQQK